MFTLRNRPYKVFIANATFRFLSRDKRHANVRFVLYDDGLLISVAWAGDGGWSYQEFLPANTNPEVLAIYDGQAWRIDEIHAWINYIEDKDRADA